jgi:hypothetical protein
LLGCSIEGKRILEENDKKVPSDEDFEKELKSDRMKWFWVTGLSVVLIILILSIPEIFSG